MPIKNKWKTCKAKIDGVRCDKDSVNGTHFCEDHGGLEGPGSKQCMGRATQTGVRCQNTPQPGRDYCKFHGGNLPIGPDHHAYSGGKYRGVAMPVKLAEKYAITQQDTVIVGLEEEIKLTDAMLMDALERLSAKEGVGAWKRLRAAVQRFMTARSDKDTRGMNEAIQEIDTIVMRGGAAAYARQDLQSWLETRRKLNDSEVKRRQILGDMVTRAQTLVMIDQIVELINQHVPDHKSRTHLAAALLKLVDPSG